MKSDIGKTYCQMTAIPRIKMNPIRSGNVHSAACVGFILMRLAIHFLPAFASIHRLHRTIPICYNCNITILRVNPNINQTNIFSTKSFFHPCIIQVFSIQAILYSILTETTSSSPNPLPMVTSIGRGQGSIPKFRVPSSSSPR